MNIKDIFATKNHKDFESFFEKNKNNEIVLQDIIYSSIDEAVKNNELFYIEELFILGLDINKKHDFLDENLLPTDLIGFSVSQGLIKLTMLLLNYGANPNSINNGHSLVASAMSRKYNDIVKLLIENGANINDSNQPSLLNIAIINKDVEMVNYLINKKIIIQPQNQADPLLLSLGTSKEIANIILNTEYSFNQNSLIENEKPVEAFSIYDGLDIELYDKIINKIANDIDINYCVDYGLPAIHKLVMSGNIPFIKILVKNGMDINKKIVREDTRLLEGCTPLFLAVHLGKEHVIKELLLLGADVNTKSKKYSSTLSLSIHNGNDRIFDYLVKNGADINEDIVVDVEEKESQMNIIHYVSKSNRPDMIRSLLSVGENIDRAIKSKNEVFDEATPLMLSVYYHAIDSIIFILENKSEINYQNKKGYSALAYAALTNQKEIFNVLLKNGANTDIKIDGKELIDLVKNKIIKKQIYKINKKNKNIFWRIKKFI